MTDIQPPDTDAQAQTFRDISPELNEIRRLLAEAYEHAFATDGMGKSSDGAITLYYPPYFWWRDDPEVVAVEHRGPRVSIYSYVLGPHRDHSFRDVDEALRAVREWHADEMERDD